MGLYLNRNIDNDTILGIWKIEEIFKWFIAQLQLNNDDLQIIPSNRDKSGLRKLHWLSTQLLLRHLLNSKEKVEINYDQNGKPHLANSSYKISISHSNKFVAIQLSQTYAGIDIQQIVQKIERIAEKFMNLKELNSLKISPQSSPSFDYTQDDKRKMPNSRKILMENNQTCLSRKQIEQLYVYWGAKETLYKIYGKRALHFKEDLLIEPFEYKGKGVINGCISIGEMKETYLLQYEKICDYMLVYVLKEINE